MPKEVKVTVRDMHRLCGEVEEQLQATVTVMATVDRELELYVGDPATLPPPIPVPKAKNCLLDMERRRPGTVRITAGDFLRVLRAMRTAVHDLVGITRGMNPDHVVHPSPMPPRDGKDPVPDPPLPKGHMCLYDPDRRPDTP
jgi:hypothetical protein